MLADGVFWKDVSSGLRAHHRRHTCIRDTIVARLCVDGRGTQGSLDIAFPMLGSIRMSGAVPLRCTAGSIAGYCLAPLGGSGVSGDPRFHMHLRNAVRPVQGDFCFG